jgi:hypothetical protein
MDLATPFEQAAFEWWCDDWLDQRREGWSDELPNLRGRFAPDGSLDNPLTKEEIVYV